MKTYCVKAKILHLQTSSSIIIWLSDNEEDFNEESSVDRSLIWIIYKDEIANLYKELGDYATVTARQINDFRNINKAIIERLEQVVTVETIQTMAWGVEGFIIQFITKLD